jgi:hypothetical protein
MDERTLLAGYRRLLAALYSPEAYYRRCALHLATARRPRGALGQSIGSGELGALFRAVWRLGVRGPRRALLAVVSRGVRRGTDLLPHAVTFAIVGERLSCTVEVVLPRLDRSLSELDDESLATRRVARAVAADSIDQVHPQGGAGRSSAPLKGEGTHAARHDSGSGATA